VAPYSLTGPPARVSGPPLTTYRNPLPTVDAIIEVSAGIVLIQRRFPPPGWALPGGFIEYGEAAEAAAVREAKEETGLDITLTELFNVYSAPDRDPRHHTIAVVFIGAATGVPVAGDDAGKADIFTAESVHSVTFAFDHGRIIEDYFAYRRTGRRPAPRL